jgi:hypothetical protein
MKKDLSHTAQRGNRVFAVPLSDLEAELIETRIDEKGMKKGAFVRMALLSFVKKKRE